MIVLYSRAGCHLCEPVRRELQRIGVRFSEVDVDLDPVLKSEYGTRVPVVELDGVPVFEAGEDPAGLSTALAGLGSL